MELKGCEKQTMDLTETWRCQETAEALGSEPWWADSWEGLRWQLPHLRPWESVWPLPQPKRQNGHFHLCPRRWLLVQNACKIQSFPSNKPLKKELFFKWLFLFADIPWLVAYHSDICYLRIYGIHFGTPATEFQRVLVGPLDSRRSDLQRWRHRSRPLHTQIPFHEDLQLAGTLQYTHLQRKNQTDICAIQVNTLHHQLMLSSNQILGADCSKIFLVFDMVFLEARDQLAKKFC